MQNKFIIILKNASLSSFAGLLLLLTMQAHHPEEGMFPLNYVNISDLKNAGLKLEQRDIFNPTGLSLTNALVKVGGCTGSFISNEGLIITNHHCVYGGVADASTVENNYLENGFVAKNKEQEIPINLPCKITESYDDVSAAVLQGIEASTTPSQRSVIIGKNITSILAAEKLKYPDKSVEISEMFVGKSYTLFRYIFLKDVRLVLAPPVTIGQFGGDSDNWEWPRHNGDFSLVRVYMGKDGKPAAFSKENVPFKPAKILKINPKGSKEGDFVFIMGYPGRTFRNETAPYLAFQEKIHLPKIQVFYAWYLGQIKEITKNNEAERLAFAGAVQSLENVEKNYRGKIQGLRRTGLVDARKMEEDQMLNWASKQAEFQKSGVQAIESLRNLWITKESVKELRYWLQFANGQSKYSGIASNVESVKMSWASLCNPKQNASKTSSQRAIEKKSMLQNLAKSLKGIDGPLNAELEKRLLVKLATDGLVIFKTLPQLENNLNSSNLFRSNENFVNLRLKSMLKKKLPETWASNAAFTTHYKSLTHLKTMAEKSLAASESITESNESKYNDKWFAKTFGSEDALSQWGRLLNFLNASFAPEWNKIEENIKAAMPIYLDMRREFKATQFIPDANSTLRLTYGYIRRYTPNDGEVHMPYTFLDGIFEKANTLPDYRLPAVIADNLRIKDIAPVFKDPLTGKVIVAMLYNLDTTGGNSGSPVLNEKGELIGINFDRSFTATINDYAWNENYSRSIGCDIRYALFIMKYISKADHVLNEIGITEEILQNK